jgi:tRNA G18 (ribose-2'-O)-methylase SpoU
VGREKGWLNLAAMTIATSISDLDDRRISAYRNLKDRELARDGDRFIAEGAHVVRRLLESDYPVESVLVAQRREREMSPLVREGTTLYVVPDPLVHEIVGFKFHSGVIACGRRKPRQPLEAAMNLLPRRATLVVCPEIANTENLGGLMRIAAGFGADAFVLGEHSCDPFYRQSIRVSMGTVFSLNLYQSMDLLSDLKLMRERWGIERIATVLDEDSEPLNLARRGDRIALLFGNEAQGLSHDIVGLCDRKVTIPMHLGTDSLNVAISAAVCLYHFSSRQ